MSSSTNLIAEQSYDEVTIAEIASHSKISVGGFYSRFRNKDALLSNLQQRLGQETQARIAITLEQDWSGISLQKLLHHVVKANAEIYQKYRGVLSTIYLKTRTAESSDEEDSRQAYNDHIVSQLTSLLMQKRMEIGHRQPKVAIRLAIACMASMLREAVVFKDASLYPKPTDMSSIIKGVTLVMYQFLAGAKQ